MLRCVDVEIGRRGDVLCGNVYGVKIPEEKKNNMF